MYKVVCTGNLISGNKEVSTRECDTRDEADQAYEDLLLIAKVTWKYRIYSSFQVTIYKRETRSSRSSSFLKTYKETYPCIDSDGVSLSIAPDGKFVKYLKK